MPVDPLWNCTAASRLMAQRRPGALIRLGREHRSWSLAAFGQRIGCSAATVSRLERRTRVADLALVQRAAAEVGMPRHVLMTSLAPPLTASPDGTRVSACSRDAEEDPMRRRTLLTATAAAGPASLLARLDDDVVRSMWTGEAQPVRIACRNLANTEQQAQSPLALEEATERGPARSRRPQLAYTAP
jgi:transcriptional regulator with XRE-family HTH domain